MRAAESTSATASPPDSGPHGGSALRSLPGARSAALLWRLRGLALSAVWAYKSRTVFTIAAVALGIASLTVIIAAVDGAQRKAVEITEMFGPDAAFILGGDIINRPVGQRRMTLSWEDALRLRQSLPGAYMVVPMRAKGETPLKYGANNFEAQRVIGATENYAEAWNWPLAEGRDLTRNDLDRAAKVALIGDVVARELFKDVDPIGKTMFVDSFPFQVVGVLTKRGMTSGGGANLDERIVIPLTTLTRRFNLDRKYFRALRVKFRDPENMKTHVEGVRGLLRELHNLEEGDPDDFTILTADEVLKFMSMLKGSLVLFLGLTAGAAMLVGGFVLANLFYLSVSERSTEIGLKKALGARSSAILIQFLLEAVILTAAGAAAGMFLGLAAGQALEGLGFLSIRLSWKIFFISAAASTAIGLIFGLRPARRAASLDPIQALRGEG